MPCAPMSSDLPIAAASLAATRVIGIAPPAMTEVKIPAELVRLDRAVLLIDEHLVEAARGDPLREHGIGAAGPAAVRGAAGVPDRLQRVRVAHRQTASPTGSSNSSYVDSSSDRSRATSSSVPPRYGGRTRSGIDGRIPARVQILDSADDAVSGPSSASQSAHRSHRERVAAVRLGPVAGLDRTPPVHRPRGVQVRHPGAQALGRVGRRRTDSDVDRQVREIGRRGADLGELGAIPAVVLRADDRRHGRRQRPDLRGAQDLADPLGVVDEDPDVGHRVGERAVEVDPLDVVHRHPERRHDLDSVHADVTSDPRPLDGAAERDPAGARVDGQVDVLGGPRERGHDRRGTRRARACGIRHPCRCSTRRAARPPRTVPPTRSGRRCRATRRRSTGAASRPTCRAGRPCGEYGEPNADQSRR